MKDTLKHLEQLSAETGLSEDEVIAKAVQSGIRQLWREHTLAAYLKGSLSREEAIEQVGIDWVELAERQRDAMEEDLAWALK